jgi:RimJ/RimL family protein N-acetyltransferase
VTGVQRDRGDDAIRTDRLLLRRFTPDDLDLLVELYGDPDVMLFVNNGRPVARSEVHEELEHFVVPREAPFGFWAAQERSTGRFLGWFHFRPADPDQPRIVELGYRLHRSAWGRGLATEGSRALIDRGFANPDLDRVVAETMVVHGASRRVMEKLGMRLVRTFHADWPVRIPGDEHGDVEYAIDRAEWQAGR